MSGIGLGGLISGVDTDSIIQKLMDIENRRIDLEAAKKAQLQAKQDAWNKVRDALSTLRSRLDGIRFASVYRARKATLSDDSVATVTAAAGATLTSHNLQVVNLAAAEVTGSAAWASATDQAGSSRAGTYQINGQSLEIVATDTLYSIRDKINGLSGANVSADVVQVTEAGATKYKLVLTSTKTGLDGAIQMGPVTSSSPAVQAAGTLAGDPVSVTVTKLALYDQVQSAAVSGTQTETGGFALHVNGTTYNVDATGKTVDQIAADINTQTGLSIASTTVNPDGTYQLTLAAVGGLAVTGDTTGLGFTTGAVVQQAELTVGTQTVTSDSNVISSPAGLTGLTLTLTDVTGSQPAQISSSFGAAFGFTDTVKARNADFYLDGIEYTNKSTNTITDVIPNLTITLKKGGATTADPRATVGTTITVGTDGEKVAGAVQDWVSALNDSISLLKNLTNYDSDTKQAGVLQGDGLARSLQTSLRSALSNVDPGLPTGFAQLSDIGVTTGAYGTDNYGKVLFDAEKLKSKLADDPDGVARIFGALRKNVALSTNGAAVSVSGTGSSGVFSAADVISGQTSATRFGTAGGGWQADTSAATLEVSFASPVNIDQIQLYMPDTAGYPSSLKDYQILWKPLSGTYQTTPLVDVTDSTGSIKLFDFEPQLVSAIQLNVTATYNNDPARVVALQVNQVSNGPAVGMYRFVNSALGIEGSLTNRTDGLSDQISDMDDRIQKMSDQAALREQQLRDQFARMESALAQMQSQGNMLLGQLGALSGQSSK